MTSRISSGPALIGVGIALNSIGLTLLVLSAFAALGLDRSGYPVVSILGHPTWIVVATLLSLGGGLIAAFGFYVATRTMIESRRENVLAR